MTILKKIVDNRAALIDKEKEILSPEELIREAEERVKKGYCPPQFPDARTLKKPLLIAEIKKMSPSKGLIRKDFNVPLIAEVYNNSGYVSAISVLTEPDFFGGSYEYLKQVRSRTDKPILMKDFIIDTYQVHRGFLAGASAFLVISSLVNDGQIENLINTAKGLNMKILFEVHTPSEYRRALGFDLDIIGINNRDLENFITDIYTTIKILDECGKPEGRIVISESGINTGEDIKKLMASHADGFLIGERFMKQQNIEASIKTLFEDGNGQAQG